MMYLDSSPRADNEPQMAERRYGCRVHSRSNRPQLVDGTANLQIFEPVLERPSLAGYIRGAHPPAHVGVVVPSGKIVVARFVVSFFAGEVVFGGIGAVPVGREPATKRHTEVSGYAAVRTDLGPLGAEPVVERKVRAGGDETAGEFTARRVAGLAIHGKQSASGKNVVCAQALTSLLTVNSVICSPLSPRT